MIFQAKGRSHYKDAEVDIVWHFGIALPKMYKEVQGSLGPRGRTEQKMKKNRYQSKSAGVLNKEFQVILKNWGQRL